MTLATRKASASEVLSVRSANSEQQMKMEIRVLSPVVLAERKSRSAIVRKTFPMELGRQLDVQLKVKHQQTLQSLGRKKANSGVIRPSAS
ncbi:unnamed protein product [Gongylonema pulchrum]|uniref:Uncharacterized protein n=1 Tax=Gongylonema pulchrum TaxID=637853 RepID=A0A183EJJ7_9BILA|nr:unnamed protein product [Gongylonema pulchrum]